MVDFSKFRHRIKILVPKDTVRNTHNENVVQYALYKEVWAKVVPKTGREYDEAQKLRAETTYNVYLRYDRNVTPDMRVEWNGITMNIESVLNLDGRSEELLLVTSEKTDIGERYKV